MIHNEPQIDLFALLHDIVYLTHSFSKSSKWGGLLKNQKRNKRGDYYLALESMDLSAKISSLKLTFR